jgi:hypothetical protein
MMRQSATASSHPMRPPYGSITARQKHWIHNDFGYRVILWDVDPLDWNGRAGRGS